MESYTISTLLRLKWLTIDNIMWLYPTSSQVQCGVSVDVGVQWA